MDFNITLQSHFDLLGGAIPWRSKKQTKIALSSTKAKYVVVVLAAKERIWIKEIL